MFAATRTPSPTQPGWLMQCPLLWWVLVEIPHSHKSSVISLHTSLTNKDMWMHEDHTSWQNWNTLKQRIYRWTWPSPSSSSPSSSGAHPRRRSASQDGNLGGSSSSSLSSSSSFSPFFSSSSKSTSILRFLHGEYDRLGPFSWKEFAVAFYFVALITLWFFQVQPCLCICICVVLCTYIHICISGASVHHWLGSLFWQRR